MNSNLNEMENAIKIRNACHVGSKSYGQYLFCHGTDQEYKAQLLKNYKYNA